MSDRSFRIRRGEVSDAAALAAFAARTFSETFAAANRPEDIAEYLPAAYGVTQQTSELADPAVFTLIGEVGTTMAAFAQVRRQMPPDCAGGDAPVELWRFYVDQPWQGRGFAQQLMGAVHGAALELGGRTLWLGVWEKNQRAIAFYEKCGFRDVGEHNFWVGGDRQTDRIMVTDVRRS